MPMSARPADDEEKRREDEDEKKDEQRPPPALAPIDVNPPLSWLKFNQRVLLQATRPGAFAMKRSIICDCVSFSGEMNLYFLSSD